MQAELLRCSVKNAGALPKFPKCSMSILAEQCRVDSDVGM